LLAVITEWEGRVLFEIENVEVLLRHGPANTWELTFLEEKSDTF
jgi:hypothetical protein